MASLKDQIKEIVEVVALVPDEFKVQCFDLLLKDALSKRTSQLAAPAQTPIPTPTPSQAKAAPSSDDSESSEEAEKVLPPVLTPGRQPKVTAGSDIVLADLHMKTRKFIEKNGVTISEINDLFYKEAEGYQTLYTDLGVTGMSEAQMRVALLQCLHHSLVDGELSTTVESVREECKIRKCYDTNNFASNFKKNAALFDFGEWSKDVEAIRLSEEGRKALAAAIKTVS